MNEPRYNPRSFPVALVAADDALRSSVRLLLTVSGMAVHEYRTARAYLAARPGSYRCLIADCPVSGMTDHSFMKVFSRSKHVPVVVLTDFPEVFELARTAHANIQTLGKPFQDDVLVDTVRASAGAAPDDVDHTRAPRAPCPAAS